jgi:8-oxo-dGTP pyrophosphatase MutT (NUDIX family)
MVIVSPKDQLPKSLNKSIFLAGPTPRSNKVESWRPGVIKELKDQGYDGVVFVPETDFKKIDYTDQVEWESKCLNIADVILFWVPRSDDMPGLTTNVEYGEWMKTGKCVLGYPKDAGKMRFLSSKAADNFIPEANSIKDTVKNALEMIGSGSLRKEGEIYVPLHIWTTQSFKNWYEALVAAGNRLDYAKVLWTFAVGPKKNIIFSWVIHVSIYIAEEKRHKTNEFVLSRTDIVTILAYFPGEKIADTKFIIVKEFRSPCSNKEGVVRELPGGSSKDSKDQLTSIASHELEEETGVKIPKDRFKYVQSRQMTATLSAHKAHLFCVELTDKEFKTLQSNVGSTHGVEEDSEKTYTEIMSLKEVLSNDNLDWSMLGMIVKAIFDTKSGDKKDGEDWVGQFLS